jgi:hypothetical protein
VGVEVIADRTTRGVPEVHPGVGAVGIEPLVDRRERALDEPRVIEELLVVETGVRTGVPVGDHHRVTGVVRRVVQETEGVLAPGHDP